MKTEVRLSLKSPKWKKKVIRGTIVSKCTWANNLFQYSFEWIVTQHSVDGKTKSDFARRYPKRKRERETKGPDRSKTNCSRFQAKDGKKAVAKIEGSIFKGKFKFIQLQKHYCWLFIQCYKLKIDIKAKWLRINEGFTKKEQIKKLSSFFFVLAVRTLTIFRR